MRSYCHYRITSKTLNSIALFRAKLFSWRAIILTLIITSSFLSGVILPQITQIFKHYVVPSPVHAQDYTSYVQCAAPALAEYMNDIIDGTQDLNNLNLLSPVFNGTSHTYADFVNQ